MRMTTPVLAAALMLLLPSPPIAAQTAKDPALQEWEVPYAESRPRDPMVAPDGRVWFVGQVGNYVSVLDPKTGDFEKFDMDDGVNPHNLIVDVDGMIYYSGNRASHIGRLDPETGEVEKFMMPDERARDPHTLIFDSRGDVWFTAQNGNFVGKLSTETGEIRLLETPSAPSRGGRMGSSRPYGIVMDSNDRPWIALFNTNKIATVDTETFELETFELPENARPRRIAITSDDVVWYGDWTRGTLGRLDPETGDIQEFPLPGGESSRPYAVTADDSDRIWLVETGPKPNNFVGFDPLTGEFFSQSLIESGGGTIRHMYFDPETNSIWFGADTNTVGQAKLPPRRRIVSE